MPSDTGRYAPAGFLMTSLARARAWARALALAWAQTAQTGMRPTRLGEQPRVEQQAVVECLKKSSCRNLDHIETSLWMASNLPSYK